LGRYHTRDELKDEDDRAGEEERRDQTEADQERVDARVVRKSRADAHDLGVTPVDEETVVHFGPPVQAISEVAVLTNSIAVTNAAAKAVAVSRLAEKVANMSLVPFVCSGPQLGHGTLNAGTVPI
jgi:hypothetical protein